MTTENKNSCCGNCLHWVRRQYEGCDENYGSCSYIPTKLPIGYVRTAKSDNLWSSDGENCQT